MLKKLMLFVLAAGVISLVVLVLRPAPATEEPKFTTPVAVDSQEALTPSALWVGDSYTEGFGATTPRVGGYPCLTSRRMGWTCNLDVQGGTGYLHRPAPRGNAADYVPFRDRLLKTRARYLADVIIIEGGRNDGSRPVEDVVEAADVYLHEVRRLWPDAEIVVVAPYFIFNSENAAAYMAGFGRVLTDRLAPMVEDIDGHLIDPVADGWIPPRNDDKLVYGDGIHPNGAGHRYIAKQLIKEFRRIGLDELKITDKRGPNFK